MTDSQDLQTEENAPLHAHSRRGFLGAAVSAGAVAAGSLALSGALSGCTSSSSEDNAPVRDNDQFSSLLLDRSNWSYDEDHDLYYQLALPYCKNPVATDFQKLSIFVPGAYFTAEKNGETYTCTLRTEGAQGAYRASTAPVVMGLNLHNFSAQIPSSHYSYEGLAPYIEQGCIYVFAGCRGKTSGYISSAKEEGTYPGGAPFTAVDLKCALRFLRLNAQNIPGGAAHISLFGTSAAGALAALLGTSGNAAAFAPYLEEAGAALWNGEGQDLSDAPTSVALWNPQIDFDAMDAHYEWLYGQYATDGTRAAETFGEALSQNLAADYAGVLSTGFLRDEAGTSLVLEETSGGIYTDGTYYQALLQFLQKGAESFFAINSFPLTLSSENHIEESFPGAEGVSETPDTEAGAAQNAAEARSQGADGVAQTAPVAPACYRSPRAYISALNKKNGHAWITLNAARNTVRIESLGDYIKAFCPASMPVTAFDGLAKNTEQNQLFGDEETATLHFSSLDAQNLATHEQTYAPLAGYADTYAESWQTDIATPYKAAQDATVAERVQMINPLSYLADEGTYANSSALAPSWRIQLGLAQSKVPFTCGFNLASALRGRDGVRHVDCTPVWEEGAGFAETGANTVEGALDWLAHLVQEEQGAQ